MASWFTKTAPASSDNLSGRKSDDPGGGKVGEGGGGGEEQSKSKERQQEEMKTAEKEENASNPWQVVKNEISQLVRSLDVTQLRSSLYSASLIDYDEYCYLNLGAKTKPEYAEDLLMTFIERGNPEEFDRFLRAMRSVETYFPIARDLKTKAEKEAQSSQGKQTSTKIDHQTGGGKDGHDDPTGPWKAVKEKLTWLKNCLDVTVLRSPLYSAKLIDYKQFCDLALSTKAAPDRAEDLLAPFIERGDEQQFIHFLGVLESVPQYCQIAETLKKTVGEHAREIGSDQGSQVCPFVMVRRLDGKLHDMAVDGNAIDKINRWNFFDVGKMQQVDAKSGNSAVSTNTKENKTNAEDADQSSNEEMLEEHGLDPNVFKSKKLLSKRVKLPSECRDKDIMNTSTGIVVLAGQVTEIVAWLRENKIVTDEQQLGKILHSSDGDVGATDEDGGRSFDVASSGIFCVLPQDMNILYVVVRLHWMDEPEVQQQVLRIALEMSPMWLIFHSRTGIEQNGFCVEAYREPKLPEGEYFQKKSDNQQMTTTGLVNQLREVIKRFPYGNNFIQSLAVLHIEYVFNVSLPFFSSTMVYHNPLMEDSQAKCNILTYETFAVESNRRTRNAEIAQMQQGIPSLTVGVSLRRKLKKSAVEAYPVDLRWWLQMSSSYVEVAMLSCSAMTTDSGSSRPRVHCFPFPDAQVTKHLGAELLNSGGNAELLEGATLSSSAANSLPLADDMATASSPWSANGNQTFVEEDDSALCRQQYGVESDDVHISWCQNLEESQSRKVSMQIRHAMENIKFPPSLTHTFLKWRGPVQTIVCVATDVKQACHFLNKLTGSSLGLFTHGNMPRTSAEEAATLPRGWECLSGSTSTPHNHCPRSNLWMCCRPSDAVLYVLMCFSHFSLSAAACPSGYKESVTLVTAAALANMFIVLTDGFPQEADVGILEGLLLPGLHQFGKRFPERGEHMEKHLFDSLLVPVVTAAELNHECTGERCCTKHFQQICKEQSWKAHREELHRYFVGIQPTCSKAPERTVENLLSESCYCHKSGNHFEQMLRLILAAVQVQGLGGIRQLQHLVTERIMEGEWIEFRKNLQNALIHGKVKGKWLSGCTEEESFKINVNGKKVEADLPTNLELDLLQDNSDREANFVCQWRARQTILEKLAGAVCAQLYDLKDVSYKNVPPTELLAAFKDALAQIIQDRKDSSTAWWERAIRSEPFSTSEGAKKNCKDFVSKFGQQWTVCGRQCQGSAKCNYYCLLPAKHIKEHNCLDPSGHHNCEHKCRLCKRKGLAVSICTKPAGHQHMGNYDNKLHMCDKTKQHLCDQPCDFREARNCTAKHERGFLSRNGLCHLRIDHSDCEPEESRASYHICTVRRNQHLCPLPCDLKGTLGCKGGLCNKVYGQHSNPHLCGKQHTCKDWCQQKGVCLRDKSGGSKRKGRQRKQGEDGWQLQCSGQKILEDHIKHGGLCNCAKEHTCDKVCPCCNCYCMKTYRHGGLCKVEHGEICRGMEVFSSTGKLVPKTVQPGHGALRCDEICKHAGRGHKHRRQNQREYILHDKFWQQLHLVDPYKESDIQQYCGCPATCQHSEHSEGQSPVYCTERLDHPKLTSSNLSETFDGKGYISHSRNVDTKHVGHHFECKHKCGIACKKMRHERQCGKACVLDLGHECACTCGEDHECGRKCAAEGSGGKCTKLSEPNHRSRECTCQTGGCIQDCQLCVGSQKEKCSSSNHLHNPFGTDKHSCKRQHPCKAECEKEGICVAVQGQALADTTVKCKGNDKLKLTCSLLCPIGSTSHQGKHTCRQQHTCNKYCPLCECYCILQIGHTVPCKTVHGPAKKLSRESSRVLTTDGEIKVLKTSVTCDQICREAGRGHLHILKCNCKATGWFTSSRTSQPKRFHETDTEDFAFHSEFWKSVAPEFTDPTSDEDRITFDLCGVLCPGCTKEGKTVACMEDVYHDLIERKNYIGRDFVGPKSHPVADGHRFPCDGHMCDASCTSKNFLGFSNCSEPCDGLKGHHQKCRCENHWGKCGEKCSALNCTEACVKDLSDYHSTHKCHQDKCDIKCKFGNCTKTCAFDHLHDVAEVKGQLSHHCGKEHACKNMCNSRGNCVRFAKDADSSSNGYHKQCKVTIPKGKEKHEGDCKCKERKHYCPTHCPLCNHVCKQEFRHEGLHTFDHGAVSTHPQIQSQSRGLMGAEGNCRNLCQTAGRGHTHPKLEDAASNQAKSFVSPDGSRILHSYFWSQYSIEDPLPQNKWGKMDGCPVMCPNAKCKVYCSGESPWHLPMLSGDVDSTVTVQHLFQCKCSYSSDPTTGKGKGDKQPRS